MLSSRANIMSMSMGKVLILTVLLVLSLCVWSSSAQDISSLLSALKQQQESTTSRSDSSLTAEEIKKVYDEKRKNLETLRKTEVSLLAVEEAIRKYGSNNVLYKQRLEKLKEIAAVKRVLQNEVASLMFLCEEKKCNSIKPKEPKPIVPKVPTVVPLPQPVNQVVQQAVPSVPSVPMATMTIGPIPLDGERVHQKRSAPPAMPKEFVDSRKQEEEIEQIFKPVPNSLSFDEDFPGFEEPPMPVEPSIPEPGFGNNGKRSNGVVWPFEDDPIEESASLRTESKSSNMKKRATGLKKPAKKMYARPTQDNLLSLLKLNKNEKKKFSPSTRKGKSTVKRQKKGLSPKSAGTKSAKKRVAQQVKTKSTETAQKKTKRTKRRLGKVRY